MKESQAHGNIVSAILITVCLIGLTIYLTTFISVPDLVKNTVPTRFDTRPDFTYLFDIDKLQEAKIETSVGCYVPREKQKSFKDDGSVFYNDYLLIRRVVFDEKTEKDALDRIEKMKDTLTYFELKKISETQFQNGETTIELVQDGNKVIRTDTPSKTLEDMIKKFPRKD